MTNDMAELVGWETEAEWELEQRAFHWNAEWPEDDTRELINDLWRQYCLAAAPVARAEAGEADDREAIAKIIDPHSFLPIEEADALVADMVEQSRQDALRKAGRIIALFELPAASPAVAEQAEQMREFFEASEAVYEAGLLAATPAEHERLRLARVSVRAVLSKEGR